MAYAFTTQTPTNNIDWNAYLQQYPDVMAEYQDESTRDDKSKNNLVSLGINNATDFAQYHYNTYGQGEGRVTTPLGGTNNASQPSGPTFDQWLQEQNAARKSQADAYNSQVSAWNQGTYGQTGQLDSIWQQISGLKLGDDLSKAQTMANQARTFASTLAGSQYGLPAAPSFSPTGYYNGQAYTLDMPTLLRPDTTMFQGVNTKVMEIQNFVNDLLMKEAAEKSRVKNAFGSAIAGFNSGDLNAKYGSLDQEWGLKADALNQQWQDLLNFDTPLTQLRDEQLGLAQTDYQELLDILTGKQSEKTAERDRISAFEQQMKDSITGLADQLGGMSIADLTNPNDYQSQLRDLGRQLSTFTGKLSYDLSDEMALLGDTTNIFTDLSNRRTAEQARVKALEADYLAQAQAALTGSRSNSMYDLFGLDALDSNLQYLRDNMASETSDLGFDWTRELGLLDQAGAFNANLRSQRQTALDKERSDVEALYGQLDSIDPWDEARLNNLSTGLAREYSDLSRFIGGTEDQTTYLTDAQSAVSQRLNDLQVKRSDIERQAQEMLNRAKHTSFYNLTDVDNFSTDLTSLEDLIQQWGAGQANDEITAIDQALGDQRSRIRQDLEAAAARDSKQAASTKDALGSLGNLSSIFGVAASNQLTDAQLLAILAKAKDDQALNDNSYSSTFSSNLGV